MSTALFALAMTALVELAVFAVAYPGVILRMSQSIPGRLAALAERNQLLGRGESVARLVPVLEPAFTEEDWAASRQLREALDTAHAFPQQRYKLNVDGRTFEVHGPLAMALKNFCSLSVEPATGKL